MKPILNYKELYNMHVISSFHKVTQKPLIDIGVDVGLTLDGSGNVQYMANASDATKALYQNTASRRPYYNVTENAVEFFTTAKELYFPYTQTSNPITDWSAEFEIKLKSTSGGKIIMESDNSSYTLQKLMLFQDNIIGNYWGNGFLYTVPNPSILTSQYNTFTFIRKGLNFKMLFNNALVINANVQDADWTFSDISTLCGCVRHDAYEANLYLKYFKFWDCAIL